MLIKFRKKYLIIYVLNVFVDQAKRQKKIVSILYDFFRLYIAANLNATTIFKIIFLLKDKHCIAKQMT